MQQSTNKRVQVWISLLTVVCALLLGYVVVIAVTGNPIYLFERPEAVLGVSEEVTETAQATAQPSPTASTQAAVIAQNQRLPTPTFIPIQPTAAPSVAEPEPASLPTDSVVIVPTEAVSAPIIPTEALPPPIIPTEVVPPAIAPTVPPTLAPPPPAVASGPVGVRLDDAAWQGGYKQSRPYGGRSATWIYGTGTDLSAMAAAFRLPGQPVGTASLSIEGMDSEDRPKTPIRISVNGNVIYEGQNPLPNDDYPIESGTWATYTWNFDAAYLQPGDNIVQIQTLTPGQFRFPPFFMLDYADVSYSIP